MRPLILKEPTKCCGSPTLLWIPAKGWYTCPCGTLQTDMDGRLIGQRGIRLYYGKRRTKGGLPEAAG
jgi:hypothetical protein